MAKSIEDQVKDLAAEVDRLARINAMKDKTIASQQRALAELNRKVAAMSSQIASLSTSLSRLR